MHLQDAKLDAHRQEIVESLTAVGLAGAVVNGTRESDWQAVADMADAWPWIVPSYGLHPWHAASRGPHWLSDLTARLDREARLGRPHGVGEIGLDRWKRPFDFGDQQSVFLDQLGLAADRNLPVSLHCLEAWGALCDHLDRNPVPVRGFLVHAYGGPAEMVRRLAARGAYFSFNGSFLHDGKEARRAVFREVPADRLLIETDAPSMPPPSERTRFHLPAAADGTPLSHPASLADVYPAVADVLGMPLAELNRQVAANFRRFFLGEDPRDGKELPSGHVPWNPSPV